MLSFSKGEIERVALVHCNANKEIPWLDGWMDGDVALHLHCCLHASVVISSTARIYVRGCSLY